MIDLPKIQEGVRYTLTINGGDFPSHPVVSSIDELVRRIESREAQGMEVTSVKLTPLSERMVQVYEESKR